MFYQQKPFKGWVKQPDLKWEQPNQWNLMDAQDQQTPGQATAEGDLQSNGKCWEWWRQPLKAEYFYGVKTRRI